MKINIICVGKLKEKYWKDAIDEYAKRISRFSTFETIEIPEEKEGQNQKELLLTKFNEGQNIIKKLKGFVIALDLQGESFSSEDIAKTLQSKMNSGISEFSFIIGGSNGLSGDVLSTADIIINFGNITFPHQLIRVVLSEQIYRALTILNNISYHK